MQSLLELINKIISIGTFPEMDLEISKKVKLLNVFITLWILYVMLCLLAVPFVPSQNTSWIYYGHGTTSLFLIVIFYLNYQRRHVLARHVFFLASFVNHSLFSLIVLRDVPGQGFVHYFFLLVAPMSVMFYDSRGIINSLLVFSWIMFLIGMKVNEPDFQIISTKNGTISMIFYLIFAVVYYFKRQNLIQEKNLKKLREDQSRFFQNIIHEIKTPLTIIDGQIQNLKNIQSDQPDSNWEIINDQIDKMKSLVKDSIDLTQLERNQVEIQTRSVVINDLTKKIVGSFMPVFQVKNIQLLFSDESRKKIRVQLDVYFFEKAINNILSNALKYTPEGRKVVVKLMLHEGRVALSIKDQGIGIPDSDQKKIFDRFYQVNNSINQAGGNGIGLAFTKEVIDLHEGSIVVQSEINIGTEFLISLPPERVKEVAKTEASGPSISQEFKKEESQPTSSKTRSSSILLVEDQYDMMEYLVKLLKGYVITCKSNGLEALNFLQQDQVDLIITDYMMPVMDGLELVGKIQERGIHTPVIVLTAIQSQTLKMDFLKYGVIDYIEKPFDQEELLIKTLILIEREHIRQNNQPESEEEFESPQDEFIVALRKFIFDCCDKHRFSVQEICNEFNMSESSLLRKTKKMVGMTPKELITETRLIKAQYLNEVEHVMNLKEILAAVGWTNQSYLNQMYEKRFGKKLKTSEVGYSVVSK